MTGFSPDDVELLERAQGEKPRSDRQRLADLAIVGSSLVRAPTRREQPEKSGFGDIGNMRAALSDCRSTSAGCLSPEVSAWA